MLAKVAIVGRPNVGKSTLFNRLIGERMAITDDMPGVTRDRIYAKGSWLDKEFNLIDTGGIDIKDIPFMEEIKAQAQMAIDEADIIIFVVDGSSGVHDVDYYIARLLQKTQKPILLAVNKIDDQKFLDNIYEFYQLGCGDPIAISSIHSIGVGDLLDLIVAKIPEKKDREYADDIIKFSLIGRPNVGKSTLVNTILGQERVITSPIAGTTRDAIDTLFKRDGKEYVCIDTAGIRKRGKIYENAEKYSLIRATDAIIRSDIVLFLIDANEGIIELDKHVSGYIMDEKKATIIVINKWDLIDKDSQEMKKWQEEIAKEFKYLSWAMIAFISALDNKRVHTLFPLIEKCYENYNRQVTTSVLNDILMDAVAMNPPAEFNHGVAKFLYISQVASSPPTFVIFVNNPIFVHFSYERYLENQLRKHFDFTGTPIKIILRKRD